MRKVAKTITAILIIISTISIAYGYAQVRKAKKLIEHAEELKQENEMLKAEADRATMQAAIAIKAENRALSARCTETA